MKLKKNVILIINLGSPDLLKVSAIRAFLAKFLGDKRVVNLSKIIWYPILYGFILPVRAKVLLAKYKQIWLADGAPLVSTTKLQAEKLTTFLNQEDIVVKHAFSYSSPAIKDVLEELHALYYVDKLIIIPLYPQFSSTTTAPVFDALARFYQDKLYLPSLEYINDFYNNPLYINALVHSIQQSWQEKGRGQKLVFSYHGLPLNLINKGDPYFDQCVVTTELVASGLGLTKDQYVLAFQSKFGKQKWLLPTTSSVLMDIASHGITAVDVICPGFVSDCLETLEEIAIMHKQIYLDAGGQQYNYINCLNDSDGFIKILADLASK